jgi:hypothetical protein
MSSLYMNGEANTKDFFFVLFVVFSVSTSGFTLLLFVLGWESISIKWKSVLFCSINLHTCRIVFVEQAVPQLPFQYAPQYGPRLDPEL